MKKFLEKVTSNWFGLMVTGAITICLLLTIGCGISWLFGSFIMWSGLNIFTYVTVPMVVGFTYLFFGIVGPIFIYVVGSLLRKAILSTKD